MLRITFLMLMLTSLTVLLISDHCDAIQTQPLQHHTPMHYRSSRHHGRHRHPYSKHRHHHHPSSGHLRGHEPKYLSDDEGLRAKRENRWRGVSGPVHTYVKTDKNANYKWGVRHNIGNKYS